MPTADSRAKTSPGSLSVSLGHVKWAGAFEARSRHSCVNSFLSDSERLYFSTMLNLSYCLTRKEPYFLFLAFSPDLLMVNSVLLGVPWYAFDLNGKRSEL